ncbi:uncharacterized protein LOC110024132 [Phalaenopsis equestris]|uniref:uncharacterized protein LOC110024132 n=1 Tax=Phalaenopsis equestris TaxID=78828 RepID=UPI0009E40B1D|nr:uncharacterized protein LOC110024132 [Phalaenopsis equestris]XP_020579576.1 uncharacterized protein LOC110024132 [Phalaenopsis equestris]XP_020579577.1 uncharacterized protein LOC110024132 [Phalaenopsis equestris]
MAADDESPRTRKMTDRGVKKLLLGEEVEVLYSEVGLKGSWHFGMIIDCGMFFRTVELADLLNEDNCSKLVDMVHVSAAIEGLKRNAPKLHRNWIRPLPPKSKIKASELIYGLCVDAFVDDAWWEGAVFDHNEGSLERLIFFPDQGDQQIINIEKLRITQEWNEASGRWKHRGVWQFLQVIKNFELEGPLPVSVREIWYDLRSTKSFLGKIGVWISGSKSIWHELVTELIQELQSVVNGVPLGVSTSYDDLCENPMNVDVIDCSREFLPLPDALQENDGMSSGSANNFPELLNPNDLSSCHTPVSENQAKWGFCHEGSEMQASKEEICGEQVIISSSGNEPNNTQHPSPHLKQCDYSLKFASIDGMLCDSNGKALNGCQEMAQKNCLNSTSISNNLASQIQAAESKDTVSDITALGSSETWQLMDLEAENCAEAIPLYLNDKKFRDCGLRRSKSREKELSSLRLKAKRHLVALGWNIEARRECGSLRVRFVSPKGQCYSSLRSACFGLLGRQPEKNGKQKSNKLKSLDGFHFVPTSYELLFMNSEGETNFHSHDKAFNVLLPVTKKKKMENSSHVTELNVSNGDIKTGTNHKKKLRLLSRMTQSNVMPNYFVMNDKSRCDIFDKRQAKSGSSSSEKDCLISEVHKQEFPMHEDIEPENFPEALTQFINYKNSMNVAAKKQSAVSFSILKLNAKNHLLSLGWRFWRTNSALFYVSAGGKVFHSLYSACKSCLEEENHCVGTSRSLINGRTRRKLDYLREMKPANIDNKLLRRACQCATTMDNENFQKASNLSQNSVENGCNDLNRSAESMACSFHQMISKEGRRSKKRRMTASTCQCLEQKLLRHSSCSSFLCEKSERGKASPALVRKRRNMSSCSSFRVRRPSKRSRQVDALSPTQYVSRTVLSLLIENDIVLPRQKVRYICKKDGHIMMEGRITREGIKCKCCSKVYSLSNFEVHAGSSLRRPAANIFLKDGRSLLQCQMQMLSSKIPDGFQRSRLKNDCSIYESDSICSVCHDGGSLILCDHCPSSFHLDCVGLEAVPEDKWFCPSCRCHICSSSEFNPDTEKFSDKTMLYCDQCEHEYHVGCMRKGGWKNLQSCPTGNWFCSASCSKIFFGLRRLIGKSKPTAVEGLSCTILRSGRDYRADCDQFDSELQAEHHSKLCVALKVLNECFVSIIEPRTQRDIVADILFNKESELKRLNFYGFYAMLLEKGDELISVATFRIYGKKIAEMPLVGTRVKYRRQGMCRLLLGEIEKLLVSVGVERFLLPAVPQLLETWTSSFGFEKMSNTDRLKLLDYTVLNFQDTTMCQKVLRVAPDNSNNDLGSEKNKHPKSVVIALPCFVNKYSPLFSAAGTC